MSEIRKIEEKFTVIYGNIAFDVCLCMANINACRTWASLPEAVFGGAVEAGGTGDKTKA